MAGRRAKVPRSDKWRLRLHGGFQASSRETGCQRHPGWLRGFTIGRLVKLFSVTGITIAGLAMLAPEGHSRNDGWDEGEA